MTRERGEGNPLPLTGPVCPASRVMQGVMNLYSGLNLLNPVPVSWAWGVHDRKVVWCGFLWGLGLGGELGTGEKKAHG